MLKSVLLLLCLSVAFVALPSCASDPAGLNLPSAFIDGWTPVDRDGTYMDMDDRSIHWEQEDHRTPYKVIQTDGSKAIILYGENRLGGEFQYALQQLTITDKDNLYMASCKDLPITYQDFQLSSPEFLKKFSVDEACANLSPPVGSHFTRYKDPYLSR